VQKIQKEFNQILNRSDSNRFNDWQAYRYDLTNHLLDVISKFTKKPKVIIIGTGNADDINLRRIEEKANQLVLTDIDDKALNSAKEKYQLTKADIITMDYLGFDDNELWNNFLTNIIKLDIDEYEDYLNKMFQQSKTSPLLKHLNKFDYVIVSPIYTQLLLPAYLQQLSFLKDINFPETNLSYLKELFLKHLSQVIIEFNQNIFKLGNNKSCYTIISDVLEAEKGSDFYKTVDSAYTNRQMDNHLDEYRDKYGYGLGDYGLEIAKEFGNEVDHFWLKWLFSSNRILYVKVSDYKKNKD
jgi:hypothetical protein